MGLQLDMLHAQTRRRHPTYESAKADWQQYTDFARTITARLPFRWHPVGVSNPRNNQRGGRYAEDHIVLDEPVAVNRLHRGAGDALCKPAQQFHGNLWVDSDDPTCKRCLEIAERLAK